MMQLCRLIAISLTALALGGCSSSSQGPPTAGESKDFAAVCDKANDGKRVAVDGYLRFPDSFTGAQSVVLRLYKTADLSGQPIGMQTTMGNQANQVELAPKEYSDKDLKVHLSNGQIVGFGTKVRVSGDVYFPIVAQNFTCALSNPLIELAH
jgi:hypothetical protein